MIDAIMAALKGAWDRNGTLGALVPGGLHYETARQPAAHPYAVVTIAEEEPQRFSGVVYVQTFLVSLMVFGGPNPVNAGQLGEVIRQTISRARKAELAIPNARVMDVKPMPGSLKKDASTRNADDVLVAQQAWQLWLQLSE